MAHLCHLCDMLKEHGHLECVRDAQAEGGGGGGEGATDVHGRNGEDDGGGDDDGRDEVEAHGHPPVMIGGEVGWGEVWGGVGRRGEIWGDVGRCGEM